MCAHRWIGARLTQIDLEKALLDPALVFASPEAVLTCADLGRDQKVAVLTRWAYDAREVSVAEEEGMTDGEPPLLDRITEALNTLVEDVDLEHTAPTKQGGS